MRKNKTLFQLEKNPLKQKQQRNETRLFRKRFHFDFRFFFF